MRFRGVLGAWAVLPSAGLALTLVISCTGSSDPTPAENGEGGARTPPSGRDPGGAASEAAGAGGGAGDDALEGGRPNAGAGGTRGPGPQGGGTAGVFGVGGALQVPVPNAACAGELSACIGRASLTRLVCRNGTFVLASCAADERCDSTEGECAPVVAECARLRPGASFCSDEVTRSICGPDLVDTVEHVCEGRCHAGRCVPLNCGDGEVQPEEECDDENDIDEDGCTGCLWNVCGDGVVDREFPGVEACDDGLSGSVACTSECSVSTCGDGIVNAAAGEDCEPDVSEGETRDTFECDADCTSASCGDGHRNTAREESCDDGVNSGEYGSCGLECTSRVEYCGDEIVNGPEICDNGFANDDDAYEGCRLDCTGSGRYCGDGTPDFDDGERCDDGNENNDDGCDTLCRSSSDL